MPGQKDVTALRSQDDLGHWNDSKSVVQGPLTECQLQRGDITLSIRCHLPRRCCTRYLQTANVLSLGLHAGISIRWLEVATVHLTSSSSRLVARWGCSSRASAVCHLPGGACTHGHRICGRKALFCVGWIDETGFSSSQSFYHLRIVWVVGRRRGRNSGVASSFRMVDNKTATQSSEQASTSNLSLGGVHFVVCILPKDDRRIVKGLQNSVERVGMSFCCTSSLRATYLEHQVEADGQKGSNEGTNPVNPMVAWESR